jgi:hypothetical protein
MNSDLGTGDRGGEGELERSPMMEVSTSPLLQIPTCMWASHIIGA